MNRTDRKQKKISFEFNENRPPSLRQIEKPKKAIGAPQLFIRPYQESQPKMDKNELPFTGGTAKLSPGLNLTRTLKSISKEPKKYNIIEPSNKEYTPFHTEESERTKYSQKYNLSKYKYANLEKVKISHKEVGIIEAYAAITNEGKRDYNEDTVSIIYNIPKPQGFIESPNNHWPNCSFFGLYDGHGGNGCSDFLRDNLHKYIISEKHFPKNPQKAIVNAFLKAEKTFLKECEEKNDISGSCAIVVLIIDKRCYVANIGDSRAILSGNNGVKTYALSRDHRPGDEKEYQRILQAGGKIYQMEYDNKMLNNQNPLNGHIIGPLRVSPGKLSVSRTIGDIEAKSEKYGGNPNVVISTPEIKYFDIADNFDFILIGCDGIFEKMKNKQIVDVIWNTIREKEFEDIHNLSGYVVERVIEECLNRDSYDNLTMIMIALKDVKAMKYTPLNEIYVAQTENIDAIKQKGGNKEKYNPTMTENIELSKTKKIGINQGGPNKQRQPLSVLLTKLVRNNTQGMKKMITCNNFENK